MAGEPDQKLEAVLRNALGREGAAVENNPQLLLRRGKLNVCLPTLLLWPQVPHDHSNAAGPVVD